MTTHDELLPDGESMDDKYNSMKEGLDNLSNGFKDVSKSLDNIERNLVTAINMMKAHRVRRMVSEYEDGKRHEIGAETAFLHRVIWSASGNDDVEDVVGFGYEYTRYAEDKVSRSEVKVQTLPDINRTFISFIEYDAIGDITGSSSTWTLNTIETMAYVADYLGFDNASQIELE